MRYIVTIGSKITRFSETTEFDILKDDFNKFRGMK